MVEILETILAEESCDNVFCSDCPFNAYNCLINELGLCDDYKFNHDELLFVSGVKWAMENLK